MWKYYSQSCSLLGFLSLKRPMMDTLMYSNYRRQKVKKKKKIFAPIHNSTFIRTIRDFMKTQYSYKFPFLIFVSIFARLSSWLCTAVSACIESDTCPCFHNLVSSTEKSTSQRDSSGISQGHCFQRQTQFERTSAENFCRWLYTCTGSPPGKQNTITAKSFLPLKRCWTLMGINFNLFEFP